MRTVFLLAGEPSGDLYAGLVARAMRETDGSVRMLGIGGPEMCSAGVEMVEGTSELGLFGFWEGLTAAGRLRGFARRVKAMLEGTRPDVFVPVSFSGVNLGLARDLDIKVVYLSPPQVWAWGKWRTKKLRRATDRVICLMPFEERFFKKLGVNAVFLGNPLVDLLKPQMNAGERGDLHRQGHPAPSLPALRLLLLPGSRPSEIQRHLPLMHEVAVRLKADVPDLEVAELPLPATGERYSLIASASLLLAASGTVTLEAALLGMPMVVVYRLSSLSYLAAKLMVRLKYFSLPNLLLERQAVPEFSQPEVKQVYRAARELLLNPDRRERMRRELAQIRPLFGEPGAAHRIAREIVTAGD
jgi:lipid-A-disaccharide synthase